MPANLTTKRDFSTLDSVINAMYESVSGPERGIDLELQRLVFSPDARLIRMGLDDDGRTWRKTMTVDEYIEDTRDFLMSNDFFEIETRRQVVHCPPFAHVLSEYEARHDPAGDELILSGVNSIQCLNDGSRWWVFQLSWNHRA